jgi:hypothetical protein
MTQTRNKTLTVGAVLLIALAATGAGVAASKLHRSSAKGAAALAAGGSPISSLSGGGHHGDGPGRGDHEGDGPGGGLTAAASYLGITPADLVAKLQAGKTLAQVAGATSGKSAAGLIDALVAAEQAELDADVAAGRITRAQADAILPTLKARVTAHVNSTGPAHDGPGHGHGGPGGDDFAAAASYLGVTEAALSRQLQAGRTLAQVAHATNGKSAAALIDALVAHETTEIDAAVAAGTVTQAQRDQIVPTLKARFTALVDGTRRPHDGRHGEPAGIHI